jgi:pimeloyl-ACP methyl ester carboxylesterase
MSVLRTISIRSVVGMLAWWAMACSGEPELKPSHEGTITAEPGISIRYRIFGTAGDTVVLVAGGPVLPARYFEVGMAPLAKGRVLVSYDLRGRGTSGMVSDKSKLGLQQDVADLDRLRADLKLGKLKLVGDNWGALVAIRYASAHPERVERVAMLAPYITRIAWAFQFAMGAMPQDRMKEYLKATGAHRDSLDPVGFCREFWPFYQSPMVHPDSTVTIALRDHMCALPADQLRRVPETAVALANSVGVEDVRDSLKGVTAPVLLIGGFQQAVYAAMYREWLEGLPTARADSVASPFGFPWLADPRRTYADLDTFLKGAWPAGVR